MDNKSTKNKTQKLFIEPLEQRIMLDGAGASTFLDLIDERNQQQITINSSNKDIYKEGDNSNKDIPFTNIARDKIRNDKKNIVFIDSAVEDYETITNSFKENTEFYLINANEDGFKRISEILTDRENIDALHLIGHGSSGQILFGNAFLNNDTIDDYQSTLTSIGQSLTTSGDILFYGCNVASTEQGEILIKKISEITKADIAASDDLTGKGGDWDLEKNTGAIEVKEIEASDYKQNLYQDGISAISTDISEYTGSNLTLSGGNESNILVKLEKANVSITSNDYISDFDVTQSSRRIYGDSSNGSLMGSNYNLQRLSNQSLSSATVNSYLVFTRGSSSKIGHITFDGQILGIFGHTHYIWDNASSPTNYSSSVASNVRGNFQNSSYSYGKGTASAAEKRMVAEGNTNNSGSSVVTFRNIGTSSATPSNMATNNDRLAIASVNGGTDNKLWISSGDNGKGDYWRVIVKQANTDPTITQTTSNDFTEDSTSEGATVGVFDVDDTETADGSLSVNITSGNDNGYYAISYDNAGTATVTLTSDGADYVNAGNDLPSYTVTVTDGDSATATATHNPSVTTVNDAPTTVPDTDSVTEGGTVQDTDGQGVVLSNDSDEDGDSLSVSGTITHTASDGSSVSGGNSDTVGSSSSIEGTYGTLTLDTDGSYSYVATTSSANALGASETGTDTFTFLVSDGTTTTSSTIKFTVNGVNDAPTAQNDTGTVNEDATLEVDDGDNANSITAAATFVHSFSVSSQDTAPQDLAFNTDGTKMFVVGSSGDAVNEYTLSTGFDVSTATFVHSFSVIHDTAPQGLAFNTDGTKMFVLGNSGIDVNEYTLSIGFDVSSATFVHSFSVSSQETNPLGLAFNTDGTKMFVSGSSGADVNEYTLSIGFDVSSATFVHSFSVSSQDTAPYGLAFNTDGTKMFVVGTLGDDVNEYTLSTGFDVSTASFVNSFSVSSQDTVPVGLAFNTDGTKMFVVGHEGDDVTEYSLTTPFSLVNVAASYSDSDSLTIAGSDSSPATTQSHFEDLIFNDDGTKMYTLGYASSVSGKNIFQYTLSTPFDVSTASVSSDDHITVGGSTENNEAIRFNNDGTKLFVLNDATSGGQSSRMYQYTLSTAYDITSTVTAGNTFTLGDYADDFRAFLFNDDGSKMFVSRYGSINEYTLRISFDTSTASKTTAAWWSSNNSYGISNYGSSSSITGMQYNSDGTKLFTVHQRTTVGHTAKIVEWSLSTAYDPMTASTNADFNDTSTYFETGEAVSSGNGIPNKFITFNNDGTKFFSFNHTHETGSSSSQKIKEWNLASPFNLVNVSGEHSGDVINTSSTDNYDTDPDGDTLTVTTYSHTSATDEDGGSISSTSSTGTAGTNNVTGYYGTLDLEDDGSYTYTADLTATQALDPGDTVTDVFTYTVDDGNGETDTATITITVNGMNDAPTAVADTDSVDAGSTVTDTTNLAGTLVSNDTDPDDSSSLYVTTITHTNGNTSNVNYNTTKISGAVTIEGAKGTLTFGSDGSYSYAANSDATSGDDVFTYTLTDGTSISTATLTITVSDGNNAPTITAQTDVAGAVTEITDGASGEGTNNLTDTGSFTIADLDNDSVSVSTAEGTTDAVGGSFLGALTATVADDTDDGSGQINWTYTVADADVEYLEEGETVTETFTVTVSDGNGGTVDQTVTVVITGANDAPTLTTGAVDVAVNEASDASAQDLSSSGTITFADLDETTTITAPDNTTVTGSAGVSIPDAVNTALLNAITVTDNSDNTADWALSASSLDLDFLTVGQTITLETVVTATDGQSATVTDTITVTITGTNDAPTLTTGAVDVAVNEASDASAQDLSSSGTITFADLDETTTITAPDNTTVTGSAGVSIPDAVNTALLNAITVTDNSDNTADWALSASSLDLDFLTAGQTITLEKVVTATDGQGATVTDTITVTITGTNDAPTLTTGAVDVAVNEASDASAQDLSSSGTITFADLDETTTITAPDNTTVTGSAGVSIPDAVNTALLNAITVTDNSDNTASWALSASSLDLDFLTVGQTITLETVVTATDGQSATATDTITVIITGTNDAPTITAQTDVAGAVTEITDGASGEGTNNLTDTGSFTIADLDNDSVSVSTAEGTTDAVGGSFLGALTATVADDTDDGSGQINWTYTVADADVEYLEEGETVTETFTVTVSDGNGGTVDQTVTVVITGANDAPVANVDTISVAAGTPATGNVVTANDTDPDGDSLIVSAIAEGDVDSPITGTYGTFTLNSDGSYTYTVDTLNADVIAWQSGDPALTETFTYTVSDGNGGTDTATITVNASGQNDAPTAADNTVTTDEDTDHTFDASEFGFTDPDGDSLDHISIETLPSKGTLLLDGSAVSAGDEIAAADITNLVFRPAADGNGDDYDSFTFSVNDGTVDSGSYTMTVNVDAVNDAPTAVDDTINVTVGTPATGNVVTANDTDPDSDPLTVSAIAGGSVGSAITGTYGSFTLNSNGSYTYTVDTLNADVIAWQSGDAVLTETFTYTVSDGNGGTNDATITVNASGQNDAPTAADNAVTTDEDTDHTFDASEFGFTDVDSDSLDHVTIETLPSKGTLLLDGSAVSAGDEIAAADIASLVFRPAADGNGDDYDSFTFSVNDGTVDSGSYTMTVNVDAVNDAPTAADNAVTTNEDTDHTFSASEFGFTDVDSDSLDHVTIETLPSEGTLLLDGVAVSEGDEIAAADIANLVFRPAANENGDDYDSFTFSVNDGTVDSASTYTMTVNVTPVNDVPTITATTENDFTEGSTSADDTVSVFNIGDTETSDSNLELSISNTTYYSITNNNDGTATVTLTTAGANYVNAGNDLPSYTVTVTDESNATATATHDPTVTPTDDTPIITATTENNFTEGSTSTGDTVAVFDVDDEETADGSLVVTIISGNDNGYYEISYDNAGTATVTLTSAGADYVNAGNDLPEYTVQVSDGSLNATTSHNPTTLENTKPEASNNTITTLEDTSYTFSSNDFGFTDDDGNTLSSVTVSSLGTNGNGTFTLNGVTISGSTTVTKAQIDNGLLKFTPSSGDNGSSYNTYTFTVNDGTDDSSSSYTMTINVTAVNDAPVATDDASSVDEDSRVRVKKNGDDLINDDSDPENDSLKVTLIKVLGGSNNSISNGSSITITGTYGQLTVNSFGGYTYRANQDAADTLDTGESAKDIFVYTVSDGNGGTDTGTLTITINGVEDNPNAVKDNVSLNISENSTLTGNAITNDIDPDDSLTIVGCGQGRNPNVGTAKTVGNTFNSNYGQMTINENGSYTFVAFNNINELLDPGQSVTEKFYYTISDGNSTSTAMIEVTIQRDNVVQELTRKEQKQIKKQIANERLNQPSTIRLLNNTTPAKTIEQTADALDNISNTKKLSFNEGIKLVDLVAETGSLTTTDGSLDKVRAKEKDGQLNLKFKVSTDLGNQIVKYEGVMPDGSKLPDWIKVDPQTGKTTTNIPEGVELVDFIIVTTDQQNNRKEIAVSIDPKEIKADKSIFKQAKKQNASLSVDQSGNVNIVQKDESGNVNKTETRNLNANDKQNSNSNLALDLNFDNTNVIKNIIETIKSDQIYQLQTITNGEGFEIKVPDSIIGSFEKTKLVLKDGSVLPDWVQFNPTTGEINANPPEDVDKLEFKLIIERDGEIIVKDLAVDVGGDDNAQILDDIENAKFIAFKDQLNKEHENWEEYGSNIINRL